MLERQRVEDPSHQVVAAAVRAAAEPVAPALVEPVAARVPAVEEALAHSNH